MSENKQPFPILRTKFHRPQIPVDFVTRPELTDYLGRYINRPLTLISAPPGYGKSTLISSCLETWEQPAVWISMDEGDSNLVRFLTYFLAGIQTIVPDFGKQTQALVNATEQSPLSFLIASLSNELEKLDQYLILVLDDYHHIHDSDIHQLISELLRFPLRTIHLILITRRDPPLPLTALRARNQMTKICAVSIFNLFKDIGPLTN